MMMLIIIKDAAKFDDIVCVCGVFLCMEENKHIKVTECTLDDTTKLGGADDGEKQMGKRQTKQSACSVSQ